MAQPKRDHIIMNEREIRETLIGFVSQIQSDYPDPGSVAVVGIQTGGAHLARRLVSMIRDRTGFEPDLGILDITLYRDDIALEKNQPIIRQTHIPFKVSGKVIVLVDDVLYTGRTVRAALDAIIDFGRPRAIRLAVVIDRGLREFPIRPDYIGRSISTQSRQTVRVELTEEGKPRDRVIISMED